MKLKILKKKNYLLVFFLLLAFFLRFAGISWGLPYHFHPDEWNMAAAITRLSWENKLDPEFFAYGQFPLYLAYFSARIYNLIPWIKISHIDISEAIFFLRFWSAAAGVGTVYLVYLTSKRLLTTNYPARIATQSVAGGSLLATLLAAFTPGLIQIAHFGTTESFLSFFFLAILSSSLAVLEKPVIKNYLFASIFLGLALGTKITALVFILPLLLVIMVLLLKQKLFKEKLKILAFLTGSLALALTLTFVTSPYLIFNRQESLRILLYETQVAKGIIPVFYTRQFINTVPIIFHLQKIFPYALGWPMFVLGFFGLVFSSLSLTKAMVKRKILNKDLSFLIFSFSFFIYFLSQAFLFTKWTRFMAPIFAFFPIFASLFISYLSNIGNLKIKTFLVGIALLPGIIFSSIYFRPDIRFTVSEWIYENIPLGSKILSETGNVVDIPLPRRTPPKAGEGGPNTYNLTPISFDFYHLDEDPKLFPQLINYLEKSDYIFVPSRRLYASHLRLKDQYPKTTKYYKLLFSGKLGFREVKTFYPFPQFLNLSISKFLSSDESAEETWSVFDHPTVRIYKKNSLLSKEQYEKLFQN